jgi:hypothetical protein
MSAPAAGRGAGLKASPDYLIHRAAELTMVGRMVGLWVGAVGIMVGVWVGAVGRIVGRCVGAVGIC